MDKRIPVRCHWAGDDPLYVAYHDAEWGVPVRDDRVLFEFLLLEGFQAGLSWLTILRKRPAFRKAFDRFDPVKIARYGARERSRLMKDEGIVRNRAKIAAASQNAKAFLAVREERGSFSDYLWDFAGGRPIRNRFRPGEVPAETDESRTLSKDLRSRGFNFVGPTICYAFMQAVGMVNDHVVECFRFRAVDRLGRGSGGRKRRIAS
jgi:DNA-3-methyladenine glycosylase I